MKPGNGRGRTTVTVEGHGTFHVEAGLNLREALRTEGFYVDGTCADKGTCGRCVVRILSGDAGAPSESESGALGGDLLQAGERLACRIVVRGDLSVHVDPERILEVDRTGRWKEVAGSPLFDPSNHTLDGEGYGVALDIGTTSIAAALYEVATGRLLDVRTAGNPQLPWGEEVISRLQASRDNPGAANQMKEKVWETVRGLVAGLARRTGISAGRVSKVVAVANSAVHHLVLGLDTAALVTPPFNPSVSGSLTYPAREAPFNLPCAKEATILFPPLLGGYAGSDALASILAAQGSGLGGFAIVDVGTNTEIAVSAGGKTAVATAPSGPAFEGGHIRCGMRAEEGAVWRVRLGPAEALVDVIGGGPPKGLCGTGIVDAVAAMAGAGLLDRSGLVRKGGHPALVEGVLVLDRPGNVVLEPGDVATVQKAKAAIAATLQTVLRAAAVQPSEIREIFLAGAFGSRLDIESALGIGLFPGFSVEQFVLAGNTAMAGASMILMSKEAREEAEELARNTTHVSVAEDPGFEERFIDNLYFPGGK